MDGQYKLSFHFHNPNDSGKMEIALVRVCIDANKSRVEQILEEIALSSNDENAFIKEKS